MTLPSPAHAPVVTLFDGENAPNALSDFRARQLLPRLQEVHDKVSGIAARFVHVVLSDTSPDAATRERLAAIADAWQAGRTPEEVAQAAIDAGHVDMPAGWVVREL